MKAGRILTVKEFKDYLRIDGAGDDAQITLFIQAASDWIERYCGRTFKEQTGLQEFYDSDGGRVLFLRERPVTLTTTLDVRVDPTQEFLAPEDQLIEETGTLDGDFVIDREFGKITLLGDGQFQRGPKTIRVDYSAGFLDDEIPDQVKLACAYHGGYFLQKMTAKNGLHLQSKTIPQGSKSLVQGVPIEITELLNPIRILPIGAETSERRF